MKFNFRDLNHIKLLCLCLIAASTFSIAVTYIIQVAKYGDKVVEHFEKELKKANKKIEKLNEKLEGKFNSRRY